MRKLLAALAVVLVTAGCAAPSTPTPAPKAPAASVPAAPKSAAAPANKAPEKAVQNDPSAGKPAQKQWNRPPELTIDQAKSYQALLKTSLGDITIDLLPQDAPKAVNNFVFLARENFYDGVKFHRVIKGFMVQTGDPTGTGRGGPGYRFDDELGKAPRNGYPRGTVAMANAGPNTNGSQFFIMDENYPLPPQYVAFGRVASGQEIVKQIASVEVGGPERSTPTRDVVIQDVTITER